MIKITSNELKEWLQYIYLISGIKLDESKAYLLETRLHPLFEELGVKTFHELYMVVQKDHKKLIQTQIINLITTNETSFFRDVFPFDFYSNFILPELYTSKIKLGGKQEISILSAGCSTGQEAYSLAILSKNFQSTHPSLTVSLTAIDISEKALSKAKKGEFQKSDIERGPLPLFAQQYFTAEDDKWVIKKEIRDLIHFRQFNLMEALSSLGHFDVIFCRNVAIYFSEEDKKKLFNRFEKILNPQGVLIIGSTETLAGLCPQYESKRFNKTIYYQVKGTRSEGL